MWPGQDGRHPPHTRLDPVRCARIARAADRARLYRAARREPGEGRRGYRRRAGATTWAKPYQDAAVTAKALEIFRELYQHDPDEQRYAVHLFCFLPGVGILWRKCAASWWNWTGRAGRSSSKAQARLKELGAVAIERLEERKGEEDGPGGSRACRSRIESPSDPLLTGEERGEFERCQRLSRFLPPVVDYLNAQVLTAEGKYFDALVCLSACRKRTWPGLGSFSRPPTCNGGWAVGTRPNRPIERRSAWIRTIRTATWVCAA